jgi:hypothetical protein
MEAAEAKRGVRRSSNTQVRWALWPSTRIPEAERVTTKAL